MVWIGTAMLVVLAMVVDGPQAMLRLRVDDWAAIGYLAVMVTAVAFLCWYACVAASVLLEQACSPASPRRPPPSPARRPSDNFRRCLSGWASVWSASDWRSACGPDTDHLRATLQPRARQRRSAVTLRGPQIVTDE